MHADDSSLWRFPLMETVFGLGNGFINSEAFLERASLWKGAWLALSYGGRENPRMAFKPCGGFLMWRGAKKRT
jgi:hypothetical protein